MSWRFRRFPRPAVSLNTKPVISEPKAFFSLGFSVGFLAFWV